MNAFVQLLLTSAVAWGCVSGLCWLGSTLQLQFPRRRKLLTLPLEVRVKFGYLSVDSCSQQPLLSPSSLPRRFLPLLRLWFAVGAPLVLLCCLLSAAILLRDALLPPLLSFLSLSPPPSISSSSPPSAPPLPPLQAAPQRLLTPALPGVNLPLAHLAFIIPAVAVSVVVHEAGHALSAVSEGVRVVSASFFVIFLLPGAFVLIDGDDIRRIHPSRALRIFCGGIWHNLALCALCLLTLLCLPALLSLVFYQPPEAVVVASIPSSSPFYGHLQPADLITAVDDKPVAGPDGLVRIAASLAERAREVRSGAVAFKRQQIAGQRRTQEGAGETHAEGSDADDNDAVLFSEHDLRGGAESDWRGREGSGEGAVDMADGDWWPQRGFCFPRGEIESLEMSRRRDMLLQGHENDMDLEKLRRDEAYRMAEKRQELNQESSSDFKTEDSGGGEHCSTKGGLVWFRRVQNLHHGRGETRMRQLQPA